VSAPVEPTPAATVLLLRPRQVGGFEVFLVRRHRRSGFMPDSFVFPGGKVDPGESFELAAARELLEEAGVLLCAGEAGAQAAAEVRRALEAKQAPLSELLATRGLVLDESLLTLWAHWITPSVEARRFSARFFLAWLPDGQVATHDTRETTDQVWVTPKDAVAQYLDGSLPLPPPTFKNLEELAAWSDLGTLQRDARARAAQVAPILPKFVEGDGKPVLLLPWDPDYAATSGEGLDFPAGHPLRQTRSRIELDGGPWWR
jgi:8-oxo-dGTP pyrophosphatase MutT (NUDIX family)